MKRVLRLLPLAAWLAFTWWESSETSPAGDLVLPFEGADKGIHFLMYVPGGAAAWLALAPMRRPPAWAAAAVLCAGWGVLDEIHQAWTPGRSPEVADAVADALGSVAGAMLAEALHARRRRTGTARPSL